MDNDDYINSYQRWVDTCVWDTVKEDSRWATVALTSEVGEFAQMVEKAIRKGNKYSKEEINSELGDVLWHVCNLLTIHDITLSECMLYNISKIEARKNEAAKAD